jgi:hypothetical protein
MIKYNRKRQNKQPKNKAKSFYQKYPSQTLTYVPSSTGVVRKTLTFNDSITLFNSGSMTFASASTEIGILAVLRQTAGFIAVYNSGVPIFEKFQIHNMSVKFLPANSQLLSTNPWQAPLVYIGAFWDIGLSTGSYNLGDSNNKVTFSTTTTMPQQAIFRIPDKPTTTTLGYPGITSNFYDTIFGYSGTAYGVLAVGGVSNIRPAVSATIANVQIQFDVSFHNLNI